jgi:hypothetical protein
MGVGFSGGTRTAGGRSILPARQDRSGVVGSMQQVIGVMAVIATIALLAELTRAKSAVGG